MQRDLGQHISAISLFASPVLLFARMLNLNRGLCMTFVGRSTAFAPTVCQRHLDGAHMNLIYFDRFMMSTSFCLPSKQVISQYISNQLLVPTKLHPPVGGAESILPVILG